MQLDKIFSSNMVFPKGKEICFYGTGKGNVKITFDGEEKSVDFCGGEWKMCFSPRDFGGPYSAVILNYKITARLWFLLPQPGFVTDFCVFTLQDLSCCLLSYSRIPACRAPVPRSGYDLKAYGSFRHQIQKYRYHRALTRAFRR